MDVKMNKCDSKKDVAKIPTVIPADKDGES